MAERLPCTIDWKDCQRCGLSKTRHRVVLGEGAHDTSLIFLGDKPGPKEDKKGEPMCGDTGILYNNLLDRVEIKREDVFTDNILACWPSKDDGDRHVTRDPTREEIKACMPRVWETIYQLDPLAIVAFGANTLAALTGQTMKITAARGDMFFAHVPGYYKVVKSYPVFPTFHPAYALRRDRAEHELEHKWAPNTIKNTILQDLLQVREFVLKIKWYYEGKYDRQKKNT